MADGFCPECEGVLKFDRPLEEGNIVTCPKCSVYLEVISVSPLEFDWVYEDDYDDDDYDDDDFDDDF
jgi:lysine biosynthesis protein LysW